MAIPSVNSPSSAAAETAATQRVALTVVTTLFFMWGFITALNDILVPHLKSIFDLSTTEAQLVEGAFFAAYGIFSYPATRIVDTFGYKKTMVSGLLTMGVGALLFASAASVPSYPLFLIALMILAAGMTALQVSANPYVSVLGPTATASSRLNLAQAFNSLGTAIAPILGGMLILTAAPKAMEVVRQMSVEARQVYNLHEASSVKAPYLVIGLALFALACAIAMFKLPPVPGAERHGKVSDSVWKHRNLVLGMVAIFMYVGAEVSIGSNLILYISRAEIGNISAYAAARYVSYYWLGAMIGRFIGSAVLQKVRTGTVLGIAALVASALVCTSILAFGHLAMWSIVLVGFFNSVMFPSIFTLGIAGLGPLTGDGSGFLIMAIIGGAVIPLLQGYLVDHSVGMHHSFILPAVCYLYIVYYAFKGSEPKVTA